MVKVSCHESGRPGFGSTFSVGNFPDHTRGFEIDAIVATLPDAWHHRVNAGTGWPGVSYCDWMRWKA